MNRNTAADVIVGYATDPAGRGIAYAAIANGSGRGVVRVPFSSVPLALYDGRETGYAAVTAVAIELRRRGYARVRVRLGDEAVVRDLAAPKIVPPALAMPYVKSRCVLNGFVSARVERADPREVADSKDAPVPSSPSGLRLRRRTRTDLPADTFDLAQSLIGQILVRRLDDGAMLTGRIVETEAYGLNDPSSHAFRRETARNRSMFLRHAHAYVYLIYGTSYCLNISTEAPGCGAAILVRAVEPLDGLDRMRALRGRPELRDIELARGPGNLCRAFAIGPSFDGLVLDTDERLWVADDGARPAIGTSVRIGLTKAADFPHRYYLRGNRAVSGPRSLSP